MGKKKDGKHSAKIQGNTKQGNNLNNPKAGNSKLSPQKRNDLNQLVDKLLKVSSSVPVGQTSTKPWDVHLTIDKLLSKVISLESDLTVPLAPRDEKQIESLTNWMESNGAVLKGVQISEFANFDYGLKATCDLSENDLIVHVPRTLMVTTENAKSSVLGNLITTDPLLHSMPNVTLALFLLLERFNPKSFWTPYISMLPSSYNTVMSFTTNQLLLLKGSPSFEPALKHCRNIARQYAYFYNLFQRSSDKAAVLLRDIFTYEHYRWAVSTIMTRQNFIPPSSEGDQQPINALIPFWDMCNHTNAKMSTDYNRETNCCECYAHRDFTAGEQVMISYGSRPNSELFLYNGFIQVDNVNDTLKLQVGVSKADPLSAERLALLELLGLPPSGQFDLTAGTRPLHGPLLAFLRVFSMSAEDIKKWMVSDNVADLNYPDRANDPQVDNKVWTFLMNRIKILLAAYPTTLEEDNKLLQEEGNNMAGCHRLAILMRQSEKKILANALTYIQNCLSEN